MAKNKNNCLDDYLCFDRIIELQTPSTYRDTYGEELKSWSSEFIPTAIDPADNKTENFGTSSKENALTTITFTIRYRDLLNEKQKITFEGNEYDILGITEVPRRKYTKINAVLIR